jgi:hypothetical protein
MKNYEMDEILTPEQWNEIQCRLKIKFPEISDEDVHYHESSENDLLRMVGFFIHKDLQKIDGLFIC